MTPARLVASVGGIGFAPSAPGTWGTAAAAVAGAGLLWAGGTWLLLAGVLLAIAAGLWSIPRAGGAADPGWVVIDEVAGTWLALLPVTRLAAWPVLAAFALFRLFDIWKPGPISTLERLPGAWGVMSDDLAAGLVAAACLFLILQAVS